MEYNNSPFSKKFKKYIGLSEEEITIRISILKDKIKQIKKDNPQNENTKVEYWLAKGFTEEEAKEKLKERQSVFSLKKCIEKHGEVKGNIVWKERQEKWQAKLKSKSKDEIDNINSKKSQSLDNHIKMYGIDTGTKLYKDRNKVRAYKSSRQYYIDTFGILEGNKVYNTMRSKSCVNNYSKISQKLFWILYTKLPEYLQSQTHFAECNSEYYKFCNNGVEKIYSYDFVIKGINKCIEFNGDFWHGNPELYEETKTINDGRTVKDLWERDDRKIKFLENKGFEVLVVWENDYKSDPEKVISTCVNFLGI